MAKIRTRAYTDEGLIYFESFFDSVQTPTQCAIGAMCSYTDASRVVTVEGGGSAMIVNKAGFPIADFVEMAS